MSMSLQKIAVEKEAVQKKEIWNFITSQAAGSSSKSPPLNLNEDDVDDEDDDDDDFGTLHLGDDFPYVILVKQLFRHQLY